jgi:hypothetical protein
LSSVSRINAGKFFGFFVAPIGTMRLPVVILSLLALLYVAQGRVITVGQSGADYTSINQAIAKAGSGDEIEIRIGDYSEQVRLTLPIEWRFYFPIKPCRGETVQISAQFGLCRLTQGSQRWHYFLAGHYSWNVAKWCDDTWYLGRRLEDDHSSRRSSLQHHRPTKTARVRFVLG